MQVHIRDVLFVSKQFTFLSGSFFKFIVEVFSFRKGYLSQRKETGQLRVFFPQQLKPINKKMYIWFHWFCSLVFLEKIRTVLEAKDAKFQWIGSIP